MLIIIHVFFFFLFISFLARYQKTISSCLYFITISSLTIYTFSFHLVSFLFYSSDLNSYHSSFISFLHPSSTPSLFFDPFPAYIMEVSWSILGLGQCYTHMTRKVKVQIIIFQPKLKMCLSSLILN